MDMAIFAAGEGSRLKAEGIQTTKPLIRINNVPIIERIIKNGIENGIEKVYCIINENSHELEEFLNSMELGERLDLIVKSTPGSFHSFVELARKIKKRPFLLTASDSVFREDEYRNFLNAARNEIADGMLAVTRYVDDEKPLYLNAGSEGWISNFSSSEGDFVTGGFYCFSPSVLGEIDTAQKLGLIHLRQFFSLLLEKGYRLKAFEFSKIIDVDHLNDIYAAEQLLSTNPMDTE